jgi:hypothetical protein
MATKTLEAAQTNDKNSNTEPAVAQGNPGDKAFLMQNFPREQGQTISVTHVKGRSFRVNVRGTQASGLPGLTMRPIVLSRFVTVGALSDGSPKIEYATRQ